VIVTGKSTYIEKGKYTMAEPAPVPKQGNHVFASVHDLLQKIVDLLDRRIGEVYENLATAQKLAVNPQFEQYNQEMDNLKDMMASLKSHHNGQWGSQQLKHTDADTEPLKDQPNPIDQFGNKVMQSYLSSLEAYLTHRVSIKHHADIDDKASHHADCKFDGKGEYCLGILYEAQYRAERAPLVNGIIEHGQDKIALKRIQNHVRNLDAKNVLSLQVKAHEQWVKNWEGLINRAVVAIDAAVDSAITLYDEMMEV